MSLYTLDLNERKPWLTPRVESLQVQGSAGPAFVQPSVQSTIALSNTPTGSQLPSASNSGSLYLIDQSAHDFDIVLPATASSSGIWYRFILATAGAHTINVKGASGTPLQAVVAQPTGNIVATANKLSVTYISGTAVAGDLIEVYGTGAIWTVRAQSGANGGITSS